MPTSLKDKSPKSILFEESILSTLRSSEGVILILLDSSNLPLKNDDFPLAFPEIILDSISGWFQWYLRTSNSFLEESIMCLLSQASSRMGVLFLTWKSRSIWCSAITRSISEGNIPLIVIAEPDLFSSSQLLISMLFRKNVYSWEGKHFGGSANLLIYLLAKSSSSFFNFPNFSSIGLDRINPKDSSLNSLKNLKNSWKASNLFSESDKDNKFIFLEFSFSDSILTWVTASFN